MKNSIKLILIAEFVIFSIFLTLDLLNKNCIISSVFKYLGIILCIILLISNKEDWHSKRDGAYTLIALIFTAFADIFLLFTDKYLVGVSIFCVAHMAWMKRYEKGIKFQLIIWGLAVFFSLLLYLNNFKVIALGVIVFTYGLFIITVTKFSFNSNLKLQSKNYAKIGMILFLLCDINVFLFNVVDIRSLIYKFSSISMWLFYLPAQVFLTLSAINIEKKKMDI